MPRKAIEFVCEMEPVKLNQVSLADVLFAAVARNTPQGMDSIFLANSVISELQEAGLDMKRTITTSITPVGLTRKVVLGK